MSSSEPVLDLPVQLSLAGAAIDRHVLELIGKPGLRSGHGYLIQRLITGPQQITTMAHDLGVTQQAVSKAVKELIGLGLAAQTIDASDNRRRPVELTDEGRRIVALSRRIRADLENSLAAAVGRADVVTTRRVLTTLLDQLGLRGRIVDHTVPAPADVGR